jgi:hypothetical protein
MDCWIVMELANYKISLPDPIPLPRQCGFSTLPASPVDRLGHLMHAGVAAPPAKAALLRRDQLICHQGACHHSNRQADKARHSGRGSMRDVFVCDAVRTPIGRFGGSLAKVRADDLAAAPIKALMARHPDLDWSQVDEIYLGCANLAGEDNRNVARMPRGLNASTDRSRRRPVVNRSPHVPVLRPACAAWPCSIRS